MNMAMGLNGQSRELEKMLVIVGYADDVECGLIEALALRMVRVG